MTKQKWLAGFSKRGSQLDFSNVSVQIHQQTHCYPAKIWAQLLDPDHVVRKSQSLTSPPSVRQVSVTAEQSKQQSTHDFKHRTDSSRCGTLHLMKFGSLLSCQSAGSMTALSTFLHPRQIISETAMLRCLLTLRIYQLSISESATPSRLLDNIAKKGQSIVMNKIWYLWSIHHVFHKAVVFKPTETPKTIC